MQNVRSKSITHRYSVAGLSPACGLPSAPPPAMLVVPVPRLRPVPGRIALFVVVLGVVAMMLAPRMLAAASPAAEPRVHVVERGETLWEVATRNSSKADPRDYVDRLRTVNGLSTPQIFPGQTLILP